MKKIVAVLVMLFSSSFAFAGEECASLGQVGCWDLVLLNADFNPDNAVIASIAGPATTEAERERRAFDIGPAIFKEMEAGRLKASDPRSFTVYMWNTTELVTPVGRILQMKPYVVGQLAAVVTDVTSSISEVDFSEQFADIGLPSAAFKVTVPASDDAMVLGASLQIPWSMITGDTYILVCPDREDTQVMYPNNKNVSQGHWVSPETLAWLKERQVTGSFMAFSSMARTN